VPPVGNGNGGTEIDGVGSGSFVGSGTGSFVGTCTGVVMPGTVVGASLGSSSPVTGSVLVGGVLEVASPDCAPPWLPATRGFPDRDVGAVVAPLVPPG